MNFIYASDIRLDSAQMGVSAKAGTPREQLKNSIRCVLANMIDLTLAEAVDFVLIAGDLYDGSWRDYNTGSFRNAYGAPRPDPGVHCLWQPRSEKPHEKQLQPNVLAFPSSKSKTEHLIDFRVAVHG